MLTDAEIIELEQLLKQRDKANLIKGLTEITDKTSPNYRFLYEAVSDQKWSYDKLNRPFLEGGYAGCVLEGSSRSTKTWGGCFFIMYLCLIRHPEGVTINIYRETYNEFKTTLYDDFKRILDMFDLPNKFKDAEEVKSFKIGKSKIHFLGDGKHGGGCDYAFFNEAMMIKKSVFDQVEMRCRIFWWMDYNPSFVVHWVFKNVLNRKDIGFLRTTFKDNRHIKPAELNKILSSEPWETGSYEVTADGKVMFDDQEVSDKNQPPPNIKNLAQGTADEFYWRVYGLGLRGSLKGAIFPNVKYISAFPNIAHVYGNDFGFTNDPNALVKYAREGSNVYVELLLYQPIETARELDLAFKQIGVTNTLPITADSSDRHVSETGGVTRMVAELFYMGWEIRKVRKTKDLMFWLTDMRKNYTIHVVINHLIEQVKTEQEMYVWKEINGVPINQPNDNFNHFWDATRYAHMSYSENNFTTSWS